MKTKAAILAENPTLISYQVTFHEDQEARDSGDDPMRFDCYAEDDEHAREQTTLAYPDGVIVSVTQDAGNDDQLVPVR